MKNESKSIKEILSNALKEDLMSYIDSPPNKIDDLIDLAKSKQPPHSAKAAWLLSKIASKKQSAIQGQVAQLIEALPIVADGQTRDLINVLTALPLTEAQEGRLFDACVMLWSDLKRIPSVRFIAMKFILSVCEKYPDLNNELILLTEDYYFETLSQGIKRAIQKRISNFRMTLD